MIKHLLVVFVLMFGLMGGAAFAVNPDEILDDPVMETRARAISANLRCLVCQNQSIDDSDADLARDLRLLVRERLIDGDSDSEVMDYVVARYGEFVLLKPVFGLHTLLLWATAPLVLIIGLLVLLRTARRAPAVATIKMTAAERAALAQLKKGEEDGEHQG